MIVQQVLHRVAVSKADELMVESYAECNFAMLAERMAHWRRQDQADLREWKAVQFRGGINGFSDNADIAAARRDCANDLAASVMLKVDVGGALTASSMGRIPHLPTPASCSRERPRA